MWSTGGTSLFAVNGCWKPGDKAGGGGGGGARANVRGKNNLVHGARCCLVLVHTHTHTHTHTQSSPTDPEPHYQQFSCGVEVSFCRCTCFHGTVLFKSAFRGRRVFRTEYAQNSVKCHSWPDSYPRYLLSCFAGDMKTHSRIALESVRGLRNSGKWFCTF